MKSVFCHGDTENTEFFSCSLLHVLRASVVYFFLTIACNAADRPFGPQAALEEAKKLEVAEGLEMTLFASEPMLVNPCDMDIDSRGRVWITEGANYRKWSNPPLHPEGRSGTP